MTDLLSASFERLLDAHCTPAQVRAIEGGQSSAALWNALSESGFLDALVPETLGGAGLTLADVYPLIETCGRYAVPLPCAQTMLARALLSAAATALPDGPVTIGVAASANPGAGVTCYGVPYAARAKWALVALPGGTVLLPVASGERTSSSPRASAATLYWPGEIAAQVRFIDAPPVDFLPIQACLLAAEMAGALLRIFGMTLQYANERTQFGRSIGKFQAIQHQISVMAENTALARTAARLGCSSETHLPHADAAAIAKSLTSEAAVSITAIAHAVHGAIGITEEYDLQLYTRRLHEWRRIAGSESYWNERIGAALIAGTTPVLDFVRRDLPPNHLETEPGERRP